MALWGGMFEGKSSALFRALNDSLPFDRAMVLEDIEGSIAWSKAVQSAGVIDAADQQKLEVALRELHALASNDASLLAGATDEDVHSWVERELVARVGDLGKKLHTGRSRNDQVATDLRLWTKKRVAALIKMIEAAQRSLTAFAAKELEAKTTLPGYTHLQRGQPVLLAHWAMAYVEMLSRDADRFADALRRIDVSPLGSGALAGTAWPVDRAQLAKDLGFAGGPTRNSLDAVSDRDFVFETLSCAALCSIHLSRLAEDLILYSSSEFGFIQMDDSVTSGSSLMPQKKNPDAAELLRGKSGRILGNLVALGTTLKGLPLAYNKDLQEDKEGIFDTVEHLSMCLAVLPICIDGMKVNRDRCNAAADDGVIAATDVADYLVRMRGGGVPFRDAHHISGRLVRRALELKTSLSAMPLAEMKAIEPRIDQDIYPHLTVAAMLDKRNVTGGTAPAQVERAIAEAYKRLGK